MKAFLIGPQQMEKQNTVTLFFLTKVNAAQSGSRTLTLPTDLGFSLASDLQVRNIQLNIDATVTCFL